MSAERVIVVAVEDVATAGVVAAAAARVGMEENASAVILLHVLDSHTVVSGLFGMSGAAAPVVESVDEGKAVLALAEAALRAEYAALDRPVPQVTEELKSGNPAAVIPKVAADAGATAIVVGARRPHAFGRLTHPDVRVSLSHHTNIPIHVAALQAGAEEPTGPEAR